MKHRRTPRRRGTLYILVLACATLVALIGLTAIAAVRTRQELQTGRDDFVAARHLARTALELGLAIISTDSEWRKNNTATWWFTRMRCGTGTLSLRAVDPVDGDIADSPCDELELTGVGEVGAARYALRVRLTADAADYEPHGAVVKNLGPLSWWRLTDKGSDHAVDAMGLKDGDYRGDAHSDTCEQSCTLVAHFDGSSDVVEVKDNKEYLLNNGALAFWFYAYNVSTFQGLVSKDADGYGKGGHLRVLVTSGVVQARLQSTTSSYTLNSTSVTANAWHHVVVCWGAGGFNLYVDGTAVDYNGYTGGLGSSSGGDGNTESWAFGMDTGQSSSGSLSGADDPFYGQLAEVAVFSRALSQLEITPLATANPFAPPYSMTVDFTTMVQDTSGITPP